MQNLKFLLVPHTRNSYDHRMMKNLADALRQFGHVCYLTSPSEASYISDYLRIKPDVIIAVNKTRPKNGAVKEKTLFLSWIQDVFPETSKTLYLERDDVLYLLGTPEQLGLEVSNVTARVLSLYTGIDDRNKISKTSDLCDFSLCGALPLNINPIESPTYPKYLARGNLPFVVAAKIITAKNGRNFLGMNFDNRVIAACKAIVEEEYRPLTGSLDINYLYDKILGRLSQNSEVIESADRIIINFLNLLPNAILRRRASVENIAKLRARASLIAQEAPKITQELASWMSQSYPRIVDRRVLISLAERVSRKILVYGNNMEAHEFSRAYYAGILDSEEDLGHVYANSRINLGNNTHGLGLHSRNLAVMAAGGYLLHHKSPCTSSGSLEIEFEDGRDFESYADTDEFEEIAHRALIDSDRRGRIGRNAQEVVYARHTWRHRAQQILNDIL